MRLVVHEEGKLERRLPIAAGMTIGRRPECELHIPNETVSGRHARIVEGAGGLAIEDLGSQNKTIVQGGPTLGRGNRHAIRPGMTLVLGKVRLEVEGDADPGPTVPGPAVRDPAGTVVDPGTAAPRPRSSGESEPADPGPTLQDPGATLQDPGATVREPQRAEGPAAAAARPSHAGEESSAIPASRMERPVEAARRAEPDELVTVDYGRAPGGAELGSLVERGGLDSLRPRLVLDNDVARQIVDVRVPELVIGRSDATLSIRHPGLSRPHARIVFEPQQKRLQVEDLGSKNYTFLSGEVLPPEMPREIPPEAHLRFGPIDALFVVDRGYEGEPISKEWLNGAADLLERRRTITREQRKLAEERAAAEQRHVGEMLILSGAVTVKQWVDALHGAGIAMVSEALVEEKVRSLRVLVWVLLAAVAALAAVTLLT